MSLLVSLLCPPKCVSCHERLPYDEKLPFCKTCLDEWETEGEEICGFCGKPVKECLCATDVMQKSGMRVLFKLAYYKAGRKTAPNQALFYMKKRPSKRLDPFLEGALAPKVFAYLQEEKTALSDCVLVHAPRHRKAAADAGTDQAERLAKGLSKSLEIPYCPAIIRKRRKNQTQKELDAQERQINARSAFALAHGIDLSGKTVLLVDDTVTTGATMATCAKLLKSAGAKRVLGVAVTLDEVGRYPKESAFSTKPYE